MKQASNKAFEEADARIILKNPNGFGFETEGYEVARKFSSIIAGKSILITGVAEGGIGSETAITIASASPALLIISARSKARASPVVAKIAAAYPAVKVEILEMDLGSFASVRSAVQQITTPLDVLICNAGIMAVPYGKTADGFEMQFGINHLGHFLLTLLLLKQDKVKNGGRIVIVSSDGHRLSDVLWDDPGFHDGESYQPWVGYGQSKTANNLMALEFARRLKSRSIQSYSLHPGVIMSTNLGPHLTPDHYESIHKLDASLGFPNWELRLKSPQCGCATHLVAAFDPTISEYNGGYLEDCHVSRTLKPWAADAENARRLWEMSEEMVRERLDA